MTEFNPEYLDAEKPELKPGQILCGGCWEVGAMLAPVGWTYFRFQHLAPQWLCPKCLEKFGAEFAMQQSAGL